MKDALAFFVHVKSTAPYHATGFGQPSPGYWTITLTGGGEDSGYHPARHLRIELSGCGTDASQSDGLRSVDFAGSDYRTITQARAKEMVSVFAKIDRTFARGEWPTTFGEYVARIAKAVGATFATFPKDGDDRGTTMSLGLASVELDRIAESLCNQAAASAA